MDFEKLVSEILARVSEKVQEAEEAADKPGLLILTQAHGNNCHCRLESTQLLEYYHTECALLKEYDCDLHDYEAVILYQMTNEVLGKLANGIYDTPYLKLASEALLMGKKIFVPEEEVELYRYKETAPAAYYQMLEEKLALLKASGVVICREADLEKEILEGSSQEPAEASLACPCEEKEEVCQPPAREEKELVISKKIITERDVVNAYADKVTVIHICKNTILTDLAKEYAQARNIAFLRSDKKGGTL